MAYSRTSTGRYVYDQENAKFFSQKLIEYILFDFGHVWKPERSKLEILFRKSSMFVFWPPIGRLVAYISRKFSGFIVIKSFEPWKFINDCRPSVRKQLLCNGIINLCIGHKLEEDDFGLLTFLAIIAEYARLAISCKQENLIDTVVDALTYCLTAGLSSGFVPTLIRLKRLSLNFKYPRNYVMCDYDRKTKFISPVKTDPMLFTLKKEVEFPQSLDFRFPSILHRTPPEDIMTQLKIRKVHKELFRRQMITDQASQTEINNDHDGSELQCLVHRREKIKDLFEIITVKNNSDSPVPDATFLTVEMRDVYVQTWSSGKPTQTNKEDADSLNAVIENPKTYEKWEMKCPMPDRSHSEIDVKKPEVRKKHE